MLGQGSGFQAGFFRPDLRHQGFCFLIGSLLVVFWMMTAESMPSFLRTRFIPGKEKIPTQFQKQRNPKKRIPRTWKLLPGFWAIRKLLIF